MSRYWNQWQARMDRLAAAGRFVVPADASRTTPGPPVDVPAVFPELKPLIKIATRLHPRLTESDTLRASGDEAGLRSRIGGPFAGPLPDRDGPMPWIPVVQLRAEDAPPKLRFEPNTDLVQLYWYPADDPAGPPTVIAQFRSIARDGRTSNALDRGGPAGLPFAWVPFPCLVFPERVAEYPPPALMPRVMRERIAVWRPPEPCISGSDYFGDRLGPAPGTKVGGWPAVAEARTPTCPHCRRLMDFLLTVDSVEWDDRTAPRWQPTEERDVPETQGYRTAIGLDFGPGRRAVHVFLCDVCPDRPAVAVFG